MHGNWGVRVELNAVVEVEGDPNDGDEFWERVDSAVYAQLSNDDVSLESFDVEEEEAYAVEDEQPATQDDYYAVSLTDNWHCEFPSCMGAASWRTDHSSTRSMFLCQVHFAALAGDGEDYNK